MPFVTFLQDYEKHFTGNTVDLRLSFAESLVRQGICKWDPQAAAETMNFAQDTDGTVNGPTAAEIAANKVLQADNTWVDGGADTHFANTSLTADMSPTHDFTGFNLTISDPTLFTVTATLVAAITAPTITFNGGAAAAATIRMLDSGIKTIDWDVPTSLTNSYTWTLPVDNPASTQAITVTNTGTMAYATIPSAFSGTQGSVVFVHSDGTLTEDNDKLFFDDTADELGINIGTNPLATLHIGRDVSTGGMFRAIRSGSGATEEAFFVGPTGSTADFLITGDGRVGIGTTESGTNAQLRVNSSHATSALTVDANDTGSATGLFIDHEGTTGEAIDVSTSITTGTGLDIQADSLETGGRLAYLRTTSSNANNRTLVEISSSNSAATGTLPFLISHNAAGILAKFNNGLSGTDTAFSIEDTGHLRVTADQTTDAAPSDDTTLKKLSIQRLGSDPTNAAFIKFSNSPGTPTNDFYLVLEEG
jgi:hypothetical protein